MNPTKQYRSNITRTLKTSPFNESEKYFKICSNMKADIFVCVMFYSALCLWQVFFYLAPIFSVKLIATFWTGCSYIVQLLPSSHNVEGWAIAKVLNMSKCQIDMSLFLVSTVVKWMWLVLLSVIFVPEIFLLFNRPLFFMFSHAPC